MTGSPVPVEQDGAGIVKLIMSIFSPKEIMYIPRNPTLS